MARSGTLVIIGGHEDKEGDRVILKTVVREVGDGKLVVATLASGQPDAMWDQYERTFRGLGVKHLYHLNVESREDACTAQKERILNDAAGVFFTGGDQLKITMMLGGTQLCERIREIYAAGGVIAGTSAGASVMCDTMIVGGGDTGSARIGETVRMAPGLGLIEDVIIDQHFAERGRVPRIIGAIAQNPRHLGIGIDENTAIVFRKRSKRFQVVGDGAVYAFDASAMTYANLAEESTDRALSAFGLRVDTLSQGDSYDIRTRTASHEAAEVIDRELELATAE